MRHRFLARMLLAMLVPSVFACGSSSPPAPAAPVGTKSCAGVKGAHHAWVVTAHLNGKVVQRCAGFDAAQVTGEQLLKSSGIEYQTQNFGSLGLAVCQVDNEPARFSQCLPANAPYWALWVSKAGSAWSMAEAGITNLELADHDALGLRYTPATEASPAPPPSPPR